MDLVNKTLTREEATELMHEHLISEAGLLRQEYTRRNDIYEYKKIPLSDLQLFIDKLWEESKRYKRKIKIRRLKRHDAVLEDKVWSLFFKSGYDQMNRDTLKIPYLREDHSVDNKQIDVFAKDDETVLVIECKSKEVRGRRSLQKDLAETKSFQSQMASTIKSFYGADFKPKIIWIYATHNIIWSEPDLDRANEINVKIITENELQYYQAFIKHMGPAGRFQILAEFLEGQKIRELENIRVPAVQGKLGNIKYFSFVTTPRHLLKISFVNHHALNHPDGRPTYQRMVKSNRLKKIGEYIKKGGFFPTNLLINFTDSCRFDLLPKQENAENNIKFGMLTLPSKYKSAWIIDGQHRLYGYSHLDPTYWNEHVLVLAFEKLDHVKEADLFITINHEQKSVPKAILVSLQSDLKWGSEVAIDRLAALSSALVKSLAADATGPLGLRFTTEGVPAEDSQSLTFPQVVIGIDKSKLIGRISKDIYIPGPLSGRTDDETIARARVVINAYFELIRMANEKRWESGKSSYIATNPGIRAHLLLLSEILSHLDYTRNFNSEIVSIFAINL